jgi:hypothetical protein
MQWGVVGRNRTEFNAILSAILSRPERRKPPHRFGTDDCGEQTKSAKANPEPALHLTTDNMNKGTVSDLDARRHYLLRADPPSRLSSRRPWKPSTRVRTGVLISIEKRRCNRDCNPCWKTAGVPPEYLLSLNRAKAHMQQGGGVDYTLAGSTITFVIAPATGDTLLVVY